MKSFNLSDYLVIGPENCVCKSFEETVSDAVRAGFTCVQIRSKMSAEGELMDLAELTAKIIAKQNKQDMVTLLINDRADVVKAARERGIKVDGVHVGQSDMSPAECRKLLGGDAIIGLSAPQKHLMQYLRTADISCVDYFGLAPLHDTETKRDLEKDAVNKTLVLSADEICLFAQNSPVPVVAGGGVKKEDIPFLAKTALSGYFVVSAVCAAEDPYIAARELAECWNLNRLCKI